MRTYTAKTKHSRPCDLCGVEIIPGDRVTTWAWVNPDAAPGDGNLGNFMRAHETCNRIEQRCPREEFHPGVWSHDDEAATALAEARVKLHKAEIKRLEWDLAGHRDCLRALTGRAD
jgi:hypothetical protein